MRLAGLLMVAVAPLLGGAARAPANAPYRGPIIDVHLHAYADAGWQVVPMAATTNFLSADELKSRSPASAAEHRAATLAAMRRAGVTLGMVSFDTPGQPYREEQRVADAWRTEGGARVRMGVSDHAIVAETPTDAIAGDLKLGRFTHLGEIGLQYHGLSPDDPKLEPYWAMAEAMGVPVGIHMGAGPPNSREQWPRFRMRLGNPLGLEEVLVRHPRLKLWFQHGGWPYLAETKAILEQYPNVHVDVSAIDWVLPPNEFKGYLKALVTAGFADRLMYGSDQMLWPQAIPKSIATINACDFLSYTQKKAIFHDNAVRFFGLTDKGV